MDTQAIIATLLLTIVVLLIIWGIIASIKSYKREKLFDEIWKDLKDNGYYTHLTSSNGTRMIKGKAYDQKPKEERMEDWEESK